VYGIETPNPKIPFFFNRTSTPKLIWMFMHSQQWLLDRQDLIRERQQDLVVLTEEEYQKIFIFFSNCKFINELCFNFKI
jgi:hypothetical protein